jgi:hypothetical protein
MKKFCLALIILISLANICLASQTQKEKLGLVGPIKVVTRHTQYFLNPSMLYYKEFYTQNGHLERQVHEIKITEAIGEHSEKFYDSKEREIKSTVSTTIYDSKKLKYITKNKGGDVYFFGDLDAGGRKINHWGFLLGTKEPYLVDELKYDARGNKIERIYYRYGTNYIKNIETMKYDEKNRLISEEQRNLENDTIDEKKYTYDSDTGWLIKEIAIINATKVKYEYDYEYEDIDQYGNWRKMTRKIDGVEWSRETREIEYYEY